MPAQSILLFFQEKFINNQKFALYKPISAMTVPFCSSNISDLVNGFRNVFIAGVFTPNQRPAKSMLSLEDLGVSKSCWRHCSILFLLFGYNCAKITSLTTF